MSYPKSFGEYLETLLSTTNQKTLVESIKNLFDITHLEPIVEMASDRHDYWKKRWKKQKAAIKSAYASGNTELGDKLSRKKYFDERARKTGVDYRTTRRDSLDIEDDPYDDMYEMDKFD